MLRLWPWKAAAGTALVVAVAWFALAASGGDVRAIIVASPVCLGLVVFFLLGGIIAVASEPAGERRDARAWALRHPWAFALWPALATAVLVFVVRRLLDLWNLNETLLSSALDGLGRAAAVLVCVALTALAARRGQKG
ncbi:hypothetical protein [Sphaerisporangium sp. TRM90804]|uniref:hypothetical protein n=1 Tax=Sphaerisporangium sp. TRM90804 TaxID=3031113 RepID=UPI0024482CD3|nr:hypothetical protein [Sphaerisporangium sp. TRM90804]MDH2427222.1 hypothetical protein [Sphaerisporangium sp. TRM90804]